MLKIIKVEHTAIFLVMILMEDAKTETWSENDPNMILLEIFTLNFLCDQDIEFDQLQSLNVAGSNVVSTPTTQSSATSSRNSGGNEGLVLDRSLHHSRDPGTAIVSLPQVRKKYFLSK